MHQAIDSFHIARTDGSEEFVRIGKVFPSNHPFVKADLTGTLFEHLPESDEESTPAPTKKQVMKNV